MSRVNIGQALIDTAFRAAPADSLEEVSDMGVALGMETENHAIGEPDEGM